MNTFLDLMQTQSLVLPVFGLVLVISAGIIALLWRGDKQELDANEAALENEERRRAERQQARLAHFYATGRLTPPWMPQGSHASMDSTPRVVNTPYSDMAQKYGFDTFKHHSRGELILFDTRYEGMDTKKRLLTFRTERVVGLDEKTLKRFMSTLRTTVNKRAQRAGLLVKRERRGHPGKGVV